MKKILFRKLLTDCLLFFFITLISASTIIWVFQAVNFLDIMIEDGRDYLVYISYTLYNFPKIISKILPFAIFFSFFNVLSRYEANNEMVIFWNFGISKLEVINFFLRFSIIILLFQMLLNAFIVPKTLDTARSLLRSSDVNFLEGFIKPKKFNDTIKGLTIFTDEKSKDGILKNIYLKKNTGKGFQITIAKYGKFENRNKNRILVLYDGQTINGDGKKITTFNFKKSDFSLDNLNTNTVYQTKTQEMPSKFLIACIKQLNFSNSASFKQDITNCSEKNLYNIYKELHKRLVVPFYLPILILISFFLVVYSKENSNYIKLKYMVFSSGVILIVFSESILKFITNEFNHNVIIFSLPIIIFFITYSTLCFLFKKPKFKN